MVKTETTIDSDGFSTVSRIKYRAPLASTLGKGKKNRKGRQTLLQGANAHDKECGQEEETVEHQVKNLNETLNSRKREIMGHGGWAAAWEELVVSLKTDSTFPNPSRMTCFGLGPVSTSRIAQCQLLLMLDLAQKLQINVLEAYDPVFSTLDKSLLSTYGIDIISENTHGHYPLSISAGNSQTSIHPSTEPASDDQLPACPSDSVLSSSPVPPFPPVSLHPTSTEPDTRTAHLFYMPHCPRTLYQNFLASNWSKSQLGSIALLANEFEGYLTREPLKRLQKEVPCLPLIAPHLTTKSLPLNFISNDVINDLAFQWVSAESLAKIDFSTKAPVGNIDPTKDEIL
ncbi:Uncharacterized conserved protein [Phaffia rhodozyma]|uniref:Uncharacterized conserved protein n=1 Tax=Phaffia rhodozyma TaxID=264483 RepID=A0A0F7SQJ1_PHARH|nr:Uncharacterized conserved protein [Phaffia rhodozyma]